MPPADPLQPSPVPAPGSAPLPAAAPQPAMRRFGDYDATRRAVFDNSLAAVKTLPPPENSRYRMEFSNLGYAGADSFSAADHKQALLQGRTLARRLTGTVTLRDKASDHVVDTRRMTLASIPYLGQSGTFILDGSPNPISHQLRLLPGIYVRQKASGTPEAHVNLLPGTGVPHRVELDPETGVFKTHVGQAELPTITLLKALGATPEELKTAWGEALYARNVKADRPHHLDKYWERFGPPGPVPDGLDKAAALAARVSKYPLDPWVSSRTLGHPHAMYGKDPLLKATGKLLAVFGGKAEPDDRDNPIYSTVWGPEHLIPERLARAGPVLSKALWQVTNAGSLKRLQAGFLTGPVRALFTKSGLAQAAEGISAAEYIDHGARLTKIGEGGIGRNADSVPFSARDISAGQYPFIDPVRTSESENVGLDLRVAFGTRLGADKKIYSPLLDRKTNRIVYRSPQDVADKVLAFPGGMGSSDPVVPVIKDGRLTHVPRHEVDYVVPSMEQAFSPLTNMVPFKSAMKAQRSSMGARFIAQALPLVNPEAPHVRTQVPNQPGKSFEELYGRHMGPVWARADQPGTVAAVTRDHVDVRYADGTTERHDLLADHPTGRKVGTTNVPLVKPGDPVAPGQILARSNYTDAKGHAAYGANLRVAYMSGNGSVTPDTLVIWYDTGGQPHHTPIGDVPDDASRGVSLDQATLEVSPSVMAKVWSHPAEGNVVTVKTNSGRTVRATTNHSFVALGEDMTVRKVAAADLVSGRSWVPRAGRIDLPVTTTQVYLPPPLRGGDRRGPQLTLDADLGFICGLYAAEGYLGGNKTAIFAVADPLLADDLCARMGRVRPGVNCRRHIRHPKLPSGRTGTSGIVAVGSATFARWLDTHCGHLAPNKKVPDFAFGAPAEFRLGFISGYWAGDGRVHCRAKGGPKDTDTMTTSRRLRDGLGLLMASVGIATTHGEYRHAAYTGGVIYRLGVATRDTHLIPKFAHTVKWDLLCSVAATCKHHNLGDLVPVPESVCRQLLARARDRFGSGTPIYARMMANRKPEGRMSSRADVRLLADIDDADPVLRRTRSLADSRLEWDRVVSVEPYTYSGPVYDFDMGDRQTFMCVDTLLVHNSTYEDSILVSQSAANRLTSDHLYRHQVAPDPDVIMGKAAHAAAFPGKHTLDTLKTLDADGLVTPGTKVESGHPLILAVRKKPTLFGRLSRSGRVGMTDASETWDHDEPGEVTDVVRGPNGPVVMVKTAKALKEADKMCYDPATDVLTTAGWKPVADVTPADAVASLTADGQLEYLNPVSTHAYPHTGRMYRLATTQASLCVTEDHKLYARTRYEAEYSLHPAADLFGVNYHLKADAVWVGEEPPTVELAGSAYTRACGQGGKGVKHVPAVTLPTETYLMLLGCFLTDGYTIYDPKAGNYGLGITQVKPANRACLQAALTAAGVKFVPRPDRFLVYGRGLAEHIRVLGKTKTKHIPEAVFAYSPRLLRVLYDWMQWGNGIEGGTSHSFCTGSRQLADDYQRLLLHIGMAGRVRVKPATEQPDTVKGVPVKTKSDTYYVHIYRHKLTPEINHAHATTQGGQREEWVDYAGTVHCVTLPRNHVLYVRRDGKAVWCGNSGRHGNKGTIVIRPDHEMPIGEDGKPVDVVLSSLGIISRANPSQIYEAILGKIAAKTGQPYAVNDWDDAGSGRHLGRWVREEARKNGVKFLETVTDPRTGRAIPNVGVGNLYMMKLHHIASGKSKGRGIGGYDENGQPLRGQTGNAMRASLGDTNALLSHGATDVLHDIHMLKGQANEEFWLSFMSGYPTPRPATSQPFDRFLTELRAGGVDPVRKDGRYHLMALTGSKVKEMTGDREVQNGETLDFGRNGEPYPGGLMDPHTFGSVDNKNVWAKISLHEPLPNPAMEEPVRRLLGLTEKQFRDTIAGTHSLPRHGTGAAGVVSALRDIDVPKALEAARVQAQSTRKTARDDAHRRLYYLKGLARTGQSPVDWVWDAVPVLPPAFRPVSPGGPRGDVIVSDANLTYKDLIDSNNAIKNLSQEAGDVGPERLNLYDAVKAVAGLGDPVGAKNRERGVKGVLGRLLGDTGKSSYVQQKLLGTPINLSGRAVAVPNPDLDMDEIGLPSTVAWEIYHPFVVRRLVRGGMPKVEAARQAADQGPAAKQALLDEMAARPVRSTRYPALHRYSTMAFRPRLVTGDALHINHIVSKMYGGDYDGDAYTVDVPLGDESVKEAYEKLLPSRNLYSPASFKPSNYLPNMEYVQGAHAASHGDAGNEPVEFKTRKDVIVARLRGEIGHDTRVRVLEDA